ncbi:MAG TPA: LapA family protein [Bauldia sp.]|nr:LapA family protein [Bauldia sp.]
MRRVLAVIVLLPLAVVAVALSVANRGDATLAFDPLGVFPEWKVTAPLFVFLFAALAVGVVIGGAATWLRQGRWRRQARVERIRAEAARQEAERLRQRSGPSAGALPRPDVRDAA